ncbi:MAG: T9SS type A sorting domain-containing protein [Flavobacteriales bacterium]
MTHIPYMHRFHGSILAMAFAVVTCVGQTYLQPTLGVQSTYTGSCLVTTCSGTSYDDGGAAGNYSPNVNAIFRTFCPNTAGMCLRATFTSFSMNDVFILCGGPGGCCDYLQVLNGPAQNSPPLYSGCVASPGTITSTNASGCLTFRFTSDNTVQLPGWAATLSCVPCAGGPSGTTNSDCGFATPICASNTFSDASIGPGISAEGCSGCNTSEYYTNWYRIQIQTSGTLAFTINPNVNSDDFDPVVYGPNLPCGALGAPLRCSYAIGAGNGNTGLGNGALDNSENVFGDQWVAPLNVTAGQTYYVLINGWSATSGANGFALNWTGTAGLDCTILPVELLYVQAACEGGRSVLEWATASEVNTSHFVVERSPDGSDWKEIGRVNSVHHSVSETKYLFVDERSSDVPSGYYRIREVDLDGHMTLSGSTPMEKCAGAGAWLQVVPNPTNGGIQIRIDASSGFGGTASLDLADATGRPVVKQQAKITEGWNAVDMDLSSLAPGTYVLCLTQADGTVAQRTRVVKQ